MARRFGRTSALKTLVVPAVFYLTLAFGIGYLYWPYFYYMKNETLIVLGAFAIWRYGWQLVHYTRGFIYNVVYYPGLKARVAALHAKRRFPSHIFFIIPSYNEEPWVSRESFHSILSEIAKIPSQATLVVATGSDQDDAVISSIYHSHPVKQKVALIFQRQSQGKRIAMGHALRCAARRYHKMDDVSGSVTIFMDGDSYLEPGTLAKMLPFFGLLPKLGAVTTNEVAYINTRSSWYKSWFNLKFGQRHILFQSHALSKKVLTLTGRFSAFRSSIVMDEELIQQVENDVITHWRHGKFRFLMGDDKSTWYYLLKNGWEMLYLPDVTCCSLESRDADFLKLSVSLPYRWYGNTLRNNARALAVGWRKTGLFIWLCILDQRLSMWTSLVGLSGAVILSLFKSFIYLPMYLAWVMIVRTLQMGVISYNGHRVGMRTIPLMLYNQWVGALIKIHSYFNLSSQQWSKGGSQQQKNRHGAGIEHPLARWMPTYSMILFYVIFFFVLLVAENAIRPPDMALFKGQARAAQPWVPSAPGSMIIPGDGRDDAPAINAAIADAPADKPLVIHLPAGELEIMTPIVIARDQVRIIGAGRDKTFLRVTMTRPAEAAIAVSGRKGEVIGRLRKKARSEDSVLSVQLRSHIGPGDLVLVSQPNDDAYFDAIGSRTWRRPHPAIRQTLVTANRPSGPGTLYLARTIGRSFDAGKTVIRRVDPVADVALEDFSIRHVVPGYRRAPTVGDYTNRFPDQAVDSLLFRWAHRCRVENVAIVDSGRHPLVFENSLRCVARQVSIDGAWNKGTGGNGYLKLSRAHHCRLVDLKVRGIRHITIQWSSSYNELVDIHSEVDLNFHGGGEHHNEVRRISFSIPATHPWQPVWVTGASARWAPPSGPDNRLDGRQVSP